MKKYIQITAGRGPKECARVVFLVFKELYKAYPTIELIETENYNGTDQEDGLWMSVIASVELSPKDMVDIYVKWIGTIQCISTKNSFRPNHKRKNWFVGVNLINPAELPEISERDIKYETCRSGGSGGQNVNKVESAVRATHIPTGLSVKSTEERSQVQNKARAKERLMFKLAELNAQKLDEEKRAFWLKHTELERGNPKQTFKVEL